MTHKNPYTLEFVQGKRLLKVWRWPTSTKVYKPITAMPAKVPVRFTAASHGLTNGWPVKITGVKGPSQVNDRWLVATVIDVNTIEFNSLNAGDMPDYAGGGYVEYFQPMDLTDMTGQVMLKENLTDAAAVIEISTANGRMIIDNAAKTITFDVAGSVSAAVSKFSGKWDWEMTAGGVTVSPLPPLERPPWVIHREGVT